MQTVRKKLIEVALPLAAINTASAREKSIRHGHPSTLHLWWARRPLAAARAVIFAQMVDDPSSWPELFPTPEAQEQERQRLFRLIEELVLWENTTNEGVLQQARAEIEQSWRRTCADHAADQRAADQRANDPHTNDLFNPDKLPAFHDPFAGGGALPLEAQRLGLESYASDLNPVAVLINKAMIEIPPKFAGQPALHPPTAAASQQALLQKAWRGAQGLAEDVRYYGQWMRDAAETRIGHLYPKIAVTAAMAQERADLAPYVGRELTVIAWLWARTVKSPNPAFAHVAVPLASTFMLSTKTGKEAWVEPLIDGDRYEFTIRTTASTGALGDKPPASAKDGTTAGKRNAFRCLISDSPITYDYIRQEGRAGRLGTKLMAIVAEGDRSRVYLTPTVEHEAIARLAEPQWIPEVRLEGKCRVNVSNYGLDIYGDLFTSRQLVALTTFSDLVQEARTQVLQAAQAAGLPTDPRGLDDGGRGAVAYADAVAVYLAFALSKLADRGSTICTWFTDRDSTRNTFARQSIPMTWDFAELNTLLAGTGSFAGAAEWTAESIEGVACGYGSTFGIAEQIDATVQSISRDKVVSTDPPYYDNIGYADLSDFFYVWLRRSLRIIFPSVFSTLATPKSEELIATPYRHGSKLEAEAFFLDGMTRAMQRLAEQAHPSFPVTIYYAFKQAETQSAGTSSTGWETFLDAVIQAGFALSGTWPMRTELGNRMIGSGTNALASSIILVCRPRPANAPTTTRRDFLAALKAELPAALLHLQRGNIAPVDLAQAAIGPGMAVYTRYARVLDTTGRALSVREALALINATLDEVLAEQEGEFDADSRWALAWFEQFGFNDGPFGDAETLSKAKNTAINGLESAGLILSRAGRVRLLRPNELPTDWDPATDQRLTAWEVVHHLARALDQSEAAAAALVAGLGSHAEIARELAYRLYTLCERKRRAQEAWAYNSLVQSWPEITRLARAEEAPRAPQQPDLFDAVDEDEA